MINDMGRMCCRLKVVTKEVLETAWHYQFISCIMMKSCNKVILVKRKKRYKE